MLRFKLRLLHWEGTYQKKLDVKTLPISSSMEYFNLEMDRFFGSVDFRPLFLPPHRCQTIILTMYCKASNESYGYPLSTGTLWSEIDQVV